MIKVLSDIKELYYSLIFNIFFYLMVYKIIVFVKISGVLNIDIIIFFKVLLCIG